MSALYLLYPLNLTLSRGLAACVVPARYPVDCVRVLLVVVIIFCLFLVRVRLCVQVLVVRLRRRVSHLGLSGRCRLALPQHSSSSPFAHAHQCWTLCAFVLLFYLLLLGQCLGYLTATVLYPRLLHHTSSSHTTAHIHPLNDLFTLPGCDVLLA